VRRVELSPFLAVLKAFVQSSIMHFPFPDQEIEIARRRSRGSGDLEISFSIEMELWNRQVVIGRQLTCLGLTKRHSNYEPDGHQIVIQLHIGHFPIAFFFVMLSDVETSLASLFLSNCGLRRHSVESQIAIRKSKISVAAETTVATPSVKRFLVYNVWHL